VYDIIQCMFILSLNFYMVSRLGLLVTVGSDIFGQGLKGKTCLFVFH
jgi:hypothetical protein